MLLSKKPLILDRDIESLDLERTKYLGEKSNTLMPLLILFVKKNLDPT